jgi:O-antigen/teichoic acid export membrane protein
LKINKLTGDSEIIFKKSFVSLLIKAFSMTSSFFIVIVLAPVLGPEGYGVYLFSLSIISVILIPSEVGLPFVIVRETIKAYAHSNWKTIKKLWNWGDKFIFTLSILGICIGVLIGLYGGRWLNEMQRTVLLIGLVTIPLVALSNKYSASIQGLNHVILGQLPSKIIRPALMLMLILIVDWSWQDEILTPGYVMGIYGIVMFIVLISSKIILQKVQPKQLQKIQSSFHDSLEWRKSTIVLTMIGGLLLLNSHMDIIMLGLMATDKDVGIYGVVSQLSLLVIFGLVAINQVLQPNIARIYNQKNLVELQKIVTFSARVVFILAIPPVLLLLFSGEWVLLQLFGEQYKSGSVSLSILVLGQIVNVTIGSVGMILNMTGNERHAASGVIAALILNLVLNMLLIPLYGMTGAAIATSTSLAAWNVMLHKRVRKILRVEPSIFGSTFLKK